MILVSHFSHRFANSLSNNPASVLATLILLSFTRILHRLVTVLCVTYVEYPTYNMQNGMHDYTMPILSISVTNTFHSSWLQWLIFLFLTLSFFSLVVSGYKSYHTCFVLLLLVALNPQQDPSANLLAIVVTTASLVAWAWVMGGVYRNWHLNLINLVGATYHVKFSQGNPLAVGYTSVSIAFATLIRILVFQLASVVDSIHYLKWKSISEIKLKQTQCLFLASWCQIGW